MRGALKGEVGWVFDDGGAACLVVFIVSVVTCQCRFAQIVGGRVGVLGLISAGGSNPFRRGMRWRREYATGVGDLWSS